MEVVGIDREADHARAGLLQPSHDLVTADGTPGAVHVPHRVTVMAQAGQEPTDVAPNAPDKLTGELLGKRVAEYALKLKK